MTQPVVVGVDGSRSSLEAVEAAAQEAALRGTGLRLVHAFGWPSIHVPPGGPPWNPAVAGVRELVDGTLIKAEQRARAVAPQLDIAREVTVGEPLMVLEIESRTASLVVVGSRGLGAFGSLLLGSTAVHLAAHARCPVLVVRGKPDPAGPVLLAVDGSPAGEGAVEFAFAEASLRGAGLLAVHVWNTWSERAYEGPGDPLNMVVDIERLREEEQRLLDEALLLWEKRYLHVAVERRLLRSRIRPALIEARVHPIEECSSLVTRKVPGEAETAEPMVVGVDALGVVCAPWDGLFRGFHGLALGSVSDPLLRLAGSRRCPASTQ